MLFNIIKLVSCTFFVWHHASFVNFSSQSAVRADSSSILSICFQMPNLHLSVIFLLLSHQCLTTTQIQFHLSKPFITYIPFTFGHNNPAALFSCQQGKMATRSASLCCFSLQLTTKDHSNIQSTIVFSPCNHIFRRYTSNSWSYKQVSHFSSSMPPPPPMVCAATSLLILFQLFVHQLITQTNPDLYYVL